MIVLFIAHSKLTEHTHTMKITEAINQAEHESENERGSKDDMKTQHKPAYYAPRNEYKPSPRHTIQRAPGSHDYTKMELFGQCVLIGLAVAGLVALFYFSASN